MAEDKRIIVILIGPCLLGIVMFALFFCFMDVNVIYTSRFNIWKAWEIYLIVPASCPSKRVMKIPCYDWAQSTL